MTDEPHTLRFRRLLAPVHERVQTFARCLCRSRSDGDDLYQEAVLRAFAKLDQLQDETAFRTWLFRIVVTVHRNRHRRSFWRRFVPFTRDIDEPIASSTSAPDAVQRISTALAMLPAEQREAIVLYELEGWKVDEIASLQEVSTSAVKSRLARGRVRLRACYTSAPPEAP